MRMRWLGLGLVVLWAACGGDDDLKTGEDPASSECMCALDTKIDNLALCISPTTAFEPAHVFSSSLASAAAQPTCEPWRMPQPVPSAPWSSIRVSSPCAGTGNFCVAVWSGSAQTPTLNDCQLARVCTPVAYAGNGQIVELAALPAWVAESSECAQRYERDGGYLEFVVESEQLGCGGATGKSTLVPLCPTRCQADPKGQGCEICGNGPVIRL